MLAGALGLRVLYRNRGKRLFRDRHEVWPCRLFILGAVLTGFGSGYYQLEPDNERFLWDRLAMMLTFMTWFVAIVSERVSLRAGLRPLPLFVASGLAVPSGGVGSRRTRWATCVSAC
jgi:hypothetical protein